MSGLDQVVQEELKSFVAKQLTEAQDFTDDVKEVSEYITILISNNKSLEETTSELTTLFDAPSVPVIIGNAYKALSDFQNGGSNGAGTSNDASAEASSAPQSSGTEQLSSSETDLILDNTTNGRSIPTKPAGLSGRIYPNKSGVGARGFKNGVGAPRNFALKNADNLQKAMELSGIPGAIRPNKKLRCHKFPHCPYSKDCKYAHPTKPCFQFPNCPNAPGTCSFLHPGQDDELIAELEKTRNEFIQKRQLQQKQQFSQNLQAQAGISLCKFGILCTNLQCPFGHPTPANEDAKVIQIEWCPQNLKCEDLNCQKAHSSLSKIKEVKPQQAEKSLDACKFGMNCTNRFCKFRHARTPVLCREGEKCTRIDCFFSHPISENCRFDTSCKNPNCLFKHPNGKSESGPPATSMKWEKTDERQFAVPEDEVLEQAPPQEEA
ncbi:Nuclear polyadenylated RNA-binding protein NAB2 [Wickerhamomyces ciferrii]|uniref:Nuclear polyadenylated RNA-binding protein NAB2 n=1 Tax=Wickerhamomyces ciferrii (strain ATCC 14091 / BCRC 22168 / CBS 111 / JCM 3599 / NBRC 0793 / NRRL Y-1031 F-60-10) TaxID=1206466 RepID=K0L048_WICCF|nr:Nuclear polyadenylated RNA-binding protein NAB2 [Wickerhamomyces ciferrii]CCH46989.1 Nuclear polyadenylated RNA-binding protein NAB2 [Wickerhamomyces ciferrii]